MSTRLSDTIHSGLDDPAPRGSFHKRYNDPLHQGALNWCRLQIGRVFMHPPKALIPLRKTRDRVDDNNRDCDGTSWN